MKAIRAAAVAAMIATGAAKPAAERVVAADGVVAATVNGQPGRLRLDPAAPTMPLIGAEWAKRAGLKSSFVGIGYAVGPEKVMGESAVARIAIDAARPDKRRVAWLSRRYDLATDGVVGPGGVPERVVRFVLRAPAPGERVTSFRLVGGEVGWPLPDWGERFAVVDLGGKPLRIRFDPRHPRTLATAGAGQRLADLHGGRLEGEPDRQEIAFGIERPVRTLALARPLSLGPFRIERLGVRTADFGNASGIADASASPDPDEVVVTAKGKRDASQDRLSLGADVLDRCSSIVFDKPARAIRLSCR